MKGKLLAVLVTAAMLTVLLYGCGQSGETVETGQEDVLEQTEEQNAEDSAAVSAETALDADEMFTDRDYETDYDESECIPIVLSDDGIEAGDGVTVDGTSATITEEGTYIVSGSLSDGQLIVDTDDTVKVRLILNGVKMSSSDSAPIYVKEADKVFITLAEGTENILSTAGDYAETSEDEDNIDAVIFSKSDLTLNGSGSLSVSTETGNGITSKDDLVFTSGTYTISAGNHGLEGKDSVRVASGTYMITAVQDGIHSNNTEDEAKGFVYIADGEFEIFADDDGIHAERNVTIDCGTITVSDGYEGIEGISIDINGGVINIAVSDDGFNAAGGNDSSGMQGSDFADAGISGGGGGMGGGAPGGGNGGEAPQMPDGESQESSGEESGESMSNADMSADSNTAADNQEGNGGGPGGGMQGDDMQSGDMQSTESSYYIRITGGIINIEAGGDGIDSNGALYVSGGETYISGPTNDANGALDYTSTAEITGGIFVAAGASGMAMNFSDSSTQGSLLVTSESSQTGTIALLDEDGNELVSYSPTKEYNSVVISIPEIEEDGTYTVLMGDDTQEITMDGLLYGSSMGNGMGGGPGGGGQRGGGGQNIGEGTDGNSDMAPSDDSDGNMQPPGDGQGGQGGGPGGQMGPGGGGTPPDQNGNE
ncbi:MAG TPA: carbohydrate-binding domain-containing protein [Lachnospiraceae bacterium]|nr:carbohydrate-binding domain-containing protein [Lachnospiraceae bacterium]